MSNHVSILIHERDAEELMQLLGRDDLPVDHWALSDRMIDRLDAALEQRIARRPRATTADFARVSLPPRR